ncbi:MAG: hypothetical protein II909_00070 [Kiritimatiellae bacterium]|nr:hypothetical protein [Kiritimatiellia bacterium]
MSKDRNYDRWYAARHVNVLVAPSHRLETFGDTIFNYHLVSELPDSPRKVRIRTGRLQAHKPAVIVPDFSNIEADGFSPEALEYIESLRQHQEYLRILRYGYHFKTDNFSEQIVTDSLAAVAERVKQSVIAKRDPFSAVVVGEDDPWDIAIVELWRREVERSVAGNIKELGSQLWNDGQKQ